MFKNMNIGFKNTNILIIEYNMGNFVNILRKGSRGRILIKGIISLSYKSPFKIYLDSLNNNCIYIISSPELST